MSKVLLEPLEEVKPKPASYKVIREYASNFGKYYVQVEVNGQVVEFGFDGEKPPAYDAVYKQAESYRVMLEAEAAKPAPAPLVELVIPTAISYLQEKYAEVALKDAKTLTADEVALKTFIEVKP